MSEPYMTTEFERELASGLEPVRAPESLWYRVEAQLGGGRSAGSRLRVAWIAGALAAAAACLGAVWFLPRPASVLSRVGVDSERKSATRGLREDASSADEGVRPTLALAQSDLAQSDLAQSDLAQSHIVNNAAIAIEVHLEFLRHPLRLDLGTCQPAQLHDWLAQSAGLAVTLAARPQRDPDRIEILGARRLSGGRAAVFYRARGYPATLLIARGGDASAKKVRRRNEFGRNVTLFEWEAHGQAYTLVSAVPAGSQQACGLCHVGGKATQG